MKFVRGEETETGGGTWPYLDPWPYLEELPRLAADMPPGARRFATDPDHYDFGSEKCVKDLKLVETMCSETSDGLRVELSLRFNDLGLAPQLRIVYRDVVEFTVHVDPEPRRGPRRLSDLMLDEILPAESGASHELVFHNGSILVLCADLDATWSENC